MTGLIDEIRADQDPRARCAMCTYVESLPKNEQAEWDAVCADRSFTKTSISRALKRREVRVSRSSVDNHISAGHRVNP